MEVRLACLGAFREVGDELSLQVQGETVGALRAALSAFLAQQGHAELNAVLERSIFAAGDELLRDVDALPNSQLAILPPVAGG